RVQLSGTFTRADESPPIIAPGTPFTGAFYVDSAAPGVVHGYVGGLPITGYQNAAISKLAIAAGGAPFTQDDHFSGPPTPGATAAVVFSQDLANGASPGISLLLANRSGILAIGRLACPPCAFNNLLAFSSSIPGSAEDRGAVAVSVTSF